VLILSALELPDMLASAAACRTYHAAYKADPPLDGAPFLHMNRWGAQINCGAWSDRGIWISDELIGGRGGDWVDRTGGDFDGQGRQPVAGSGSGSLGQGNPRARGLNSPSMNTVPGSGPGVR
jgi:hypothetical protein